MTEIKTLRERVESAESHFRIVERRVKELEQTVENREQVIKERDELLFAYESVKAPMLPNPEVHA